MMTYLWKDLSILWIFPTLSCDCVPQQDHVP